MSDLADTLIVMRKVDRNMQVLHRPGLITGKADLYLAAGKERFLIARKIHKTQVQQWREAQDTTPVPYAVPSKGGTYWQFQDRWYWDDHGLDYAQVYAVVATRRQREQAKVERAQAMVAMGLPTQRYGRRALPDDVKQLVWMRDEGRCQYCEAQAELEYDHIIPIAMGGSSNVENLQLLCGPCNRRKGAGLTMR